MTRRLFAIMLVMALIMTLSPVSTALAKGGSGLDYNASPNYGSAKLGTGFTPDPFTVAVIGGGDIDVSALNLGQGCVGNATRAPDFRLYWFNQAGQSNQLRIFFVGDGSGDPTLIVNNPAEQWVCNDDSAGSLNPMVEVVSPASGQYDIWVGSLAPDAAVSGTLYVTEGPFDPSNPGSIGIQIQPPAGQPPAGQPGGLPGGQPGGQPAGQPGGQPGGQPAGAGLDIAANPTYGATNLNAGFLPDPHTASITSGGSVNTGDLNLSTADGSVCYGHATSAPDYRIQWSGQANRLRIYFVGNTGDATLLVNDASGQWYCGDDSAGTVHPMVELANPAQGQIDVWVGNLGGNQGNSGTLYVTEFEYDPSNPDGQGAAVAPPAAQPGGQAGGGLTGTDGGAVNAMGTESRGAITCGQTVSGTIGSDLWNDEWTFNSAAGDNITFTMMQTGVDLDPYLILMPQGGQPVPDDDGAGFPNAQVSYSFTNAGLHTILATRFGSDIGLSFGTYTLEMACAAVGQPPVAPPAGQPGASVDISAAPTFGSSSLNAGFAPDPTVVGMTSGGNVDLSSLGGSCWGFTASPPDYRIQWSGQSSRLRLFFVGNGDTTMAVNDASGVWWCGDDSAGTLNPMVEILNPAQGQIDIWIGSFASNEAIPGSLYITELDYDPSNAP